jgi:hypothetical protein
MASSNGSTTYSFKDSVGAFVSVLAGIYTITGGKVGAGQITVNNVTEHSELDTASDGAVMTSFISGDAGDFTVECQQTSAIHKYFLAAFNLHKSAADGGDVSNWASSALQLRNIVDGSEHLLTGISFTKAPTKVYASRGQMVAWKLNASNVINL